MTREEIEKKVLKHLRIKNGIEWKCLTFQGDLGFDSLKTVEVFMECEEMFNIEFSDEEIMKTDTIGRFIDIIEKKITIKN